MLVIKSLARITAKLQGQSKEITATSTKRNRVKQRTEKKISKNPLLDIQVQVQERRTPISGAPEEKTETN